MYKLVRPFLFSQDPETIHEIMQTLGEKLSSPWITKPLAKVFGFSHKSLQTRVLGIDFPNPIGLAAGFDKNAKLINILGALGFGFLEVGTITPRTQAGSPKPRLFRLPQDRAIINRFGFNNDGVDAVVKRLQQRSRQGIVGISIVKNSDVPNEEAIGEYAKCFYAVYDHVDFIVLNVSSLNTFRLRELQAKQPLMSLLNRMKELQSQKTSYKPILVKIAPDLSEQQLDDIIEVVNETHIDGIIATNTTSSHEGLKTSGAELQVIRSLLHKNPETAKLGDGGLSGEPLAQRSTEVIRYIFHKSQGQIPIIGAGGVFSAEDAYEKIRAGASLVQLYTGLIYEGPGIVKKIKQGLVKLLERDGLSSIQEAVGRG